MQFSGRGRFVILSYFPQRVGAPLICRRRREETLTFPLSTFNPLEAPPCQSPHSRDFHSRDWLFAQFVSSLLCIRVHPWLNSRSSVLCVNLRNLRMPVPLEFRTPHSLVKHSPVKSDPFSGSPRSPRPPVKLPAHMVGFPRVPRVWWLRRPGSPFVGFVCFSVNFGLTTHANYVTMVM